MLKYFNELFDKNRHRSKLIKTIFLYTVLPLILFTVTTAVIVIHSTRKQLSSEYKHIIDTNNSVVETIYQRNINKLEYIKTHFSTADNLNLMFESGNSKIVEAYTSLKSLFNLVSKGEQGEFKLYTMNDNAVKTDLVYPFSALDDNIRTLVTDMPEYGYTAFAMQINSQWNMCFFMPIYVYSQRIGYVEWRIPIQNIFNSITINNNDKIEYYYQIPYQNITLKYSNDIISQVQTVTNKNDGITFENILKIIPHKTTIVMPKNKFLNNIFIIVFIYLTVLLLLVGFVMSLSLKTTDNLTHELYGLMDYIKNNPGKKSVSTKDFLGKNPSVEFSFLFEKFSVMINTLNTYHDTIKQHELTEKQLELELLQANINPHFLYNSLSALRWISNNEKVDSMIKALISFYRISLNNGKIYTTLGQELEMLRFYLRVHEISGHFNITYTEHIDDSIIDFVTLKNILQPIFENAIMHGIAGNDSKGSISTDCRLNGDFVVIKISDDGIGMSSEKIQTLLNADNTSRSYGIKNVIRRLKFYYGNDFDISIDSHIGKGTVVTIKIKNSYLPKE